jgi:hypothetical protein
MIMICYQIQLLYPNWSLSLDKAKYGGLATTTDDEMHLPHVDLTVLSTPF